MGVRIVSADEAQRLIDADAVERRNPLTIALARTVVEQAHLAETQAATIRRQSLDYLTLDGQAIELQDRLREVEAEREAEKARADAAEAKVRAVKEVRSTFSMLSERGERALDAALADPEAQS